MKSFTILKSSLICLTIFSLFGCASTLPPKNSGFLGDYSKLKTSEKFENTNVYVSPAFDKKLLAKSRKIKVEPFEIWINQQPKSSFNPDQLIDLSKYFHQQFITKLESNYQMMDIADEDTLIIRGAFSGVKFNKPELNVGDFIPIRMVLNAGNTAYLMATDQKDVITEVSIEAEFVTGSNQQRVFAMTATKQLDATIAKDGKDNSEAVKQVLDIWVNNFVNEISRN